MEHFYFSLTAPAPGKKVDPVQAGKSNAFLFKS